MQTWAELMVQVFTSWCTKATENTTDTPEPAPLKRLREVPPETRKSIVFLLRKRLATFPYSVIHPTWIVELMPKDPLVKCWTMGVIPPDQRPRVLNYLPLIGDGGIPHINRTGPPPWFENWWHHYLRAKLGYTQPVEGSTDLSIPLTVLWTLKDNDILLFLRIFGLRSMAAVSSQASPQEVIKLVYSLETDLQPILVRYVREKKYSQEDFWTSVYTHITPDVVVPHLLPLYLALADIARVIRTQGRKAEGLYLMYRLPRNIGITLKKYWEQDWAETPPEDIHAWDEAMQHDLAFLIKKGVIKAPAVPKEDVLS